MWIYIQSEPRLWTVGHYSPDGEFHADGDHGSRESAGRRCHRLNGGRDIDDTDDDYVELLDRTGRPPDAAESP